jgi:LysM repeat protein
MPDRARQRRTPARYLAPLALLATGAGIYLIVHSTVATHNKPAHAKPDRRSRAGPHVVTHAHSPPVKPKPSSPERFYVVRPGDGLDLIASRTGVSLQTLEALNPGVSSTSLRVGQRLILRR